MATGFSIPERPGAGNAQSGAGVQSSSPQSLLGEQPKAQDTDVKGAIRTLSGRAAEIQQQFMDLFEQYPAAARHMRELKEIVGNALRAAVQALTQSQEGPKPPMTA